MGRVLHLFSYLVAKRKRERPQAGSTRKISWMTRTVLKDIKRVPVLKRAPSRILLYQLIREEKKNHVVYFHYVWVLFSILQFRA